MPDTPNDTRPAPRGQPLTLNCQRVEPDEAAARLALPGVVTGYRDFDGIPILTSLDELADAEGGAA